MKTLKNNQKGFTLIEIIAVLVILGILAAVAVPRYINLADDARNKAAVGAVAAAQSALSMRFAQVLLSTGTAPDGTAIVPTSNCGVGTGDFTVTCTGAATSVSISAVGSAGGTATGAFIVP